MLNVPIHKLSVNIQGFAGYCRYYGMSIERTYWLVFGVEMSEARKRLTKRTVFPLGYVRQRGEVHNAKG